jgi:anthranilate synthase component 1
VTFKVENNQIILSYSDGKNEVTDIINRSQVVQKLSEFVNSFELTSNEPLQIDGVVGYTAYDGVKYFEEIDLKSPVKPEEYIPELQYSFYRFIIAVNHYKNELSIIEFLKEGEKSNIAEIETHINNRNFAVYDFEPLNNEISNLTNEQYIQMVTKGKEHCHRGDVFQIVLSRQFSQNFKGDDFNVYRTLRSINPSPYLFYFDYGNFRIFGSSPETQIEVRDNKAFINPIAGTFKRTGDDIKDKELAEKLSKDPKENSEHIMLVDLARNDLSRTTDKVKVTKYREIQYYSHVLHMVSKVSGELRPNANKIDIMAESFPAGTLSGAPKYRAMELIDEYENKARGYYGGYIGIIRFNGDINQAIMIRTFLSKDNTLFYQAGAGIVVDSVEKNELNEVNNKLGALKSAIEMARHI